MLSSGPAESAPAPSPNGSPLIARSGAGATPKRVRYCDRHVIRTPDAHCDGVKLQWEPMPRNNIFPSRDFSGVDDDTMKRDGSMPNAQRASWGFHVG
eukprot:5144602-Pyramimonas_sp.AAC.1